MAMAIGVLLFILSFGTSLIVHWGGFDRILFQPSDPLGYYQFLPGTFIKHDLHGLPWVHRFSDGTGLSIFTIGVAWLQLPFFLIGHLVAVVIGSDADGYSTPYAIAQLIGASSYLGLAACMLFNVLTKRHSAMLAATVILILYLATNLFYYSSFEAGMSHVYSFFLFSLLLYTTERSIDHPRTWPWIWPIGAMIVLVRPLNIFVLLIPLLYGIRSMNEPGSRLRDLFKGKIAWMMLGFAIALVLPQLLYWHAITGEFVLFTYGVKGESFDLSAPHLWDILISHQNGWFVYTPIMLLVMLRLLTDARSRGNGSRTILLCFAIAWYLYGSWWAWWLGGAFGYRGFIEYYALLSIPLAGLLQWIFSGARGIRITSTALIVLFIFFNIRLSIIYRPPWDGADWNWDRVGAAYREALLIR